MIREGRRFRSLILVAVSAALLGSCAAPFNFVDPAGPRFARCCVSTLDHPVFAKGAHSDVTTTPHELRVVTFNIKFGKQIDKAIEVLEHARNLKSADFVFLQEMDPFGVQRIASHLGMCYVYYPATVHPATGRLFGPAILSRWPLSEDHKVLLPHLGRFRKTERIAVAATADVRGRTIRVYSVHIATGIETGPSGRRDQVLALLADADRRYDRVIIGGDLNAKGLGKLITAEGYDWPTRDLGRTSRFAGVDHIFVRGLPLEKGTSAGKVSDNLGASDHKPVWAKLMLSEGVMRAAGEVAAPSLSGARAPASLALPRRP